MLVVRTEGGFVVRLDAGEEVRGSRAAVVVREGIAGGCISGIGTLRNTTIGYFDRERREYDKRRIDAEMELVSLSGNITWVDGEHHPMIHAHVTLAGPDFVSIGGHLFSGEIAVTGELFVIPTEVRIAREFDERTGLKLIHGGSGN